MRGKSLPLFVIILLVLLFSVVGTTAHGRRANSRPSTSPHHPPGRDDHAGDVEVKFPSPAVGPGGIPHVMWSDQRNGASREAVFVRSRLAAP